MWSSIVTKGVPYKYCVYTPKTRSTKDAQYEHIENGYRDYPDEFTNRYLKLPKQKCKLFAFNYNLKQ